MLRCCIYIMTATRTVRQVLVVYDQTPSSQNNKQNCPFKFRFIQQQQYLSNITNVVTALCVCVGGCVWVCEIGAFFSVPKAST